MPALYVSHNDGIPGLRGDALFYKKGRNGPGETIPIHIADCVVIPGKGSVSTPALHFIMENDIPLHFIDSGGRCKGRLTSGRGRGYLVKKRQFDAAANGRTAAAIARSIAAGKLRNQLATLPQIRRIKTLGLRPKPRQGASSLYPLQNFFYPPKGERKNL
jgi:CRISPR/Cas system-associated endonuclease Cas1